MFHRFNFSFFQGRENAKPDFAYTFRWFPFPCSFAAQPLAESRCGLSLRLINYTWFLIDRGLSADVSHFPWSINSREKICLPVVNRIIENEKIDWHDYKFMFHERRRVKMEHLIDQEKLKWIMRNAFLTLPPSFLWKNYCSRNRRCWACWNPLFYLLRKLCFRLTQILKSQSSTCCCRKKFLLRNAWEIVVEMFREIVKFMLINC